MTLEPLPSPAPSKSCSFSEATCGAWGELGSLEFESWLCHLAALLLLLWHHILTVPIMTANSCDSFIFSLHKLWFRDQQLQRLLAACWNAGLWVKICILPKSPRYFVYSWKFEKHLQWSHLFLLGIWKLLEGVEVSASLSPHCRGLADVCAWLHSWHEDRFPIGQHRVPFLLACVRFS